MSRRSHRVRKLLLRAEGSAGVVLQVALAVVELRVARGLLEADGGGRALGQVIW